MVRWRLWSTGQPGGIADRLRRGVLAREHSQLHEEPCKGRPLSTVQFLRATRPSTSAWRRINANACHAIPSLIGRKGGKETSRPHNRPRRRLFDESFVCLVGFGLMAIITTKTIAMRMAIVPASLGIREFSSGISVRVAESRRMGRALATLAAGSFFLYLVFHSLLNRRRIRTLLAESVFWS